MNSLKDYAQEQPINHLMARHWDEIEIKEVAEALLRAVKQNQLADFVVTDSLQKETVLEYFAAFAGQELRCIDTVFTLFYQVAAADDYNDLRGHLLLTFQTAATEYRVLLGMSRLGNAEGVRWQVYDVLWQDQGISVADVPLVQLEAPESGEEICVLVTNHGDIRLRLFPDQAPLAVANWQSMAKDGFYDGSLFARVIKEFVIQGGALDGSGDEALSNYGGYFADEVRKGLYHFNGAVALGNHGPHTNGNQFFIVQNTKVNEPQLPKLSLPRNVEEAYLKLGGLPELDGRYTVFGQVYKGMDIVVNISDQMTDAEDAPLKPVVIQRVIFERV
ncbi:peptidylprolyl isomerase [Enterococcus sp. AZ109]|uniref:peptidylprolyl isomerase n=1 Tax=Enterococcus sp. AZ109 TaxID=2774634 RepID=UPI003F1E9825